MKLPKLTFIIVSLLLLTTVIEARKKSKHKSSQQKAAQTKTKTKWSTSTDGANSLVATEEQGYYVKRTYFPLNATDSAALALRSIPYLAIPIAWFSCESKDCAKGNSGAINGNSNALNEGFLCDDDCVDPYEPICGKTSSEVAVFYNKCKLNVAKCRTHGLWTDFAYETCKQSYPKEVELTNKKFRASPFFRDNTMTVVALEDTKEDAVLEAAIEALHEFNDNLTEAPTDTNDSGESAESTTLLNKIKKS